MAHGPLVKNARGLILIGQEGCVGLGGAWGGGHGVVL